MCKLVLPDLLFHAVELFKNKNISYGTMASVVQQNDISMSRGSRSAAAQKPLVSFAINKSMSRGAVSAAAQEKTQQNIAQPEMNIEANKAMVGMVLVQMEQEKAHQAVLSHQMAQIEEDSDEQMPPFESGTDGDGSSTHQQHGGNDEDEDEDDSDPEKNFIVPQFPHRPQKNCIFEGKSMKEMQNILNEIVKVQKNQTNQLKMIVTATKSVEMRQCKGPVRPEHIHEEVRLKGQELENYKPEVDEEFWLRQMKNGLPQTLLSFQSTGRLS